MEQGPDTAHQCSSAKHKREVDEFGATRLPRDLQDSSHHSRLGFFKVQGVEIFHRETPAPKRRQVSVSIWSMFNRTFVPPIRRESLVAISLPKGPPLRQPGFK